MSLLFFRDQGSLFWKANVALPIAWWCAAMLCYEDRSEVFDAIFSRNQVKLPKASAQFPSCNESTARFVRIDCGLA